MKTKTSFRLFLSSVFLLISFFGIGQEIESDTISQESNNVNSGDRQEMVQELMDKLALTSEQEIEVKKVFAENQQELKALKESDGDRRSKFKQLKEISQQTDEALKAILDDKQYNIYKTHRKEQREKMLSKAREYKD
ncbi:hypothetical protein HX109_00975 [Galbibacter sp. BG1]|uniref:hypothetical protein n=1 Tax=Galbibacter sp. BG1 TaxID=1170699 RepID=UPI0015C13DA6|nr:hypothetical protein [Galbibacter sp. BG1]QLE00202.1 hypothetical protein HX109_00975 [Galbibacter sp. BG1]